LTLGLFLFSVGIGWACASKYWPTDREQRAHIIGNWLQSEKLVPGTTTWADEARRIAFLFSFCGNYETAKPPVMDIRRLCLPLPRGRGGALPYDRESIRPAQMCSSGVFVADSDGYVFWQTQIDSSPAQSNNPPIQQRDASARGLNLVSASRFWCSCAVF
jgi:hypothetical protein